RARDLTPYRPRAGESNRLLLGRLEADGWRRERALRADGRERDGPALQARAVDLVGVHLGDRRGDRAERRLRCAVRPDRSGLPAAQIGIVAEEVVEERD